MRSASGSIFNAAASSSIADSSANEPVVSPGARMKVGVPRFIGTIRCVVTWLGTVYNMRVTMQQVSVQSSNIDVFEILSWRIAVNVPSCRAASVKCCSVCGRAPTGPNICGRSSTRRTGRPVCFAAIAHSDTCDHDEPLQPKPPPINGEITRTSPGAMPNVWATA